jgi:hypothetical protein
MKPVSRIMCSCGAMALLALVFTFRNAGAQRICCQGDLWLHWDLQARRSYIDGYGLGYTRGHDDGCEQATHTRVGRLNDGQETAAQHCAEQQLDFSKGDEQLEKLVTTFYKTYPDSRDINIFEVLDLLAKNRTLDEIHRYPFMRHKVPTP